MKIALDFIEATTRRYLDNQFDAPSGGKLERVTLPVIGNGRDVNELLKQLEPRFVDIGAIWIGARALRIGPVMVVGYEKASEHRGDTSIGSVVDHELHLDSDWEAVMWNCQLSAKRFFKFETAIVQTSLREV